MLGYVTIGTNDKEMARAFYEPLFAAMGYAVRFEDKQVVSWGDPDDDDAPRFFICTPFDDEPATVGNGTMVAFRAATASKVDDLHAIAMAGGGRDEGAPGFRPERYGDRFYVAYARDPDGNKLAFACYDGKANP